MNPSPLRMLVTRHICPCRRSISPPSYRARRLLYSSTPRHASFNPPAGFGNPEELRRRYKTEPASIGRDNTERAQTVRRMKNATYGIAACTLAIIGTIYLYPDHQQSNTIQHDAPPPSSIISAPHTIADQTDLIPTGTSTIPFFPRLIQLSTPATSTPASTSPLESPGATLPLPETITQGSTEYHLLGLGIRTVSILSIQVYVVGLYIAAADIAKLQQTLIRKVDPVATTLVSLEKDKLRDLLMDPTQGEQIFNELIEKNQLRTAIRIVPTRNTDWMHMRDGFVRGITARAAHFTNDLHDDRFTDDTFGASLNDFKSVFGGGSRRKIPWGETLYLLRDGNGTLSAVHEDKGGTRTIMGEVADERISRLLWLGYLAGKSVSSEDARKKIIDGCVEVCGRPVGTVAEQVV